MIKDFLKRVQRAGWILVTAHKGHCVAKCPNASCGMVAKFVPGKPIPQASPMTDHIVIVSFEDLLAALKHRRHELALTIPEVEHAAGFSSDHLAKAESSKAVRTPGLQLCIQWAQALGYEIVLKPAPLPPVTLRHISDSRHLVPHRRTAQRRRAANQG
ncbi:hypothetical protein JANAI62_03820 [Jannaschia pagri]|uniref:XRE family transcriptional regulator n=1 Tax=Jannaschia pagri TaxID=2829797 RepID=A0ABQ4NH68_9RHOB|nr:MULTISPECIES: hypothetical protein [unclassified Jannaschia]GIT90135.1 hypothetical protein JANAI61_05930 [Jannaschia sp. AI_61]GIT93759.1 hypothetical protein JANAI62_03820 [Jannaschia sp. AI_62]